MTFLGDEGRDVLVVKRILVDHKLTLLGPITSVGSIYMGPIYYYFMIPFLWLFNFDPVGPTVMVVLLSLATIYLIFRLGSEFFHTRVGLVASLLYSISPLTIIYGRSSWNPNVVPFFSSLFIYSIFQAFIKNKYLWLVFSGLSLGVLFQLHYVTFIFVPTIAALWVIFRPKIPIKNLLLSVFAFITAYFPFILFEIRHQFVNTQGAWRFLWQQKSEATTSFFHTISDVLVRLFWRLVVIENAELTKFLLVLLGFTLYLTFKLWTKNPDKTKALKMLIIWFFAGIFSFGLYRGVIYDYYFGSLFPLPFLFVGIMTMMLWKYSKVGKVIATVILISLVFFNLKHSPNKIEPNNMLKNTETISQFVFDLADNKPYNFALIAGQNSDHAYRYFLELWKNPPKVIENPDIDPGRDTVTEKLIVVCEEKVCQPLGHPLWEIAGFGRAEITGQWHVVTTDVFQLKHFE